MGEAEEEAKCFGVFKNLRTPHEAFPTSACH